MFRFVMYGGLLITILSGCTLALPLSIATTGMVASDERSVGEMIDDKLILSRIKTELSKSGSAHLFLSVHVNVLEGRVLLTGSVASRECADEAVKIAWKTRGVKEVINELIVELKSVADSAKDTLIASGIKSKFLLEKNFLSTNYTVAVNDGTVFLLGIAQDQNELDKALTISSHVVGVKKVRNYVILKNDPRRK